MPATWKVYTEQHVAEPQASECSSRRQHWGHLLWGTFWAGDSSQGISEPLHCQQDLKGRPKRQERGELGLGLEPIPGTNQSPRLAAVAPWPGASVAPVGRDGRQEGSGRRPGTSCTQEGGPGRGDSLSALSTLYGSVLGLVPLWGEAAGQGTWGRGCVHLVSSVCQAFYELCLIHCFIEPTPMLLPLLPHFTDGETEAQGRKGLSQRHTEIKGRSGQKASYSDLSLYPPWRLWSGEAFLGAESWGAPATLLPLPRVSSHHPTPSATTFVDTDPTGNFPVNSILAH